jgi:hypothetical protein
VKPDDNPNLNHTADQSMINFELTDAEILDDLLSILETRLPESVARVTGARGVKDFGPGPEGWDGMVGRLRTLGWNETANQLVSGYDFGDPAMQAMLDQLGQIDSSIFTPDRVAAMKAWGVTRTPKWQTLGIPEMPTLESVAALRLDHDKRSILEATRSKINAKATAIGGWLDSVDVSAKSLAELQAYCDELLASPDGNTYMAVE